MKISELHCSASLSAGVLTLESGETIELQKLYDTLDDLREYAICSTLEEDQVPSCCYTADLLLEAFQ